MSSELDVYIRGMEARGFVPVPETIRAIKERADSMKCIYTGIDLAVENGGHTTVYRADLYANDNGTYYARYSEQTVCDREAEALFVSATVEDVRGYLQVLDYKRFYCTPKTRAAIINRSRHVVPEAHVRLIRKDVQL
jgi:hypothetical protein